MRLFHLCFFCVLLPKVTEVVNEQYFIVVILLTLLSSLFLTINICFLGAEHQNFKSSSGCVDSGTGCRSHDCDSNVCSGLGSGISGTAGGTQRHCQVQSQLYPSATYRQRHRLSLTNCYASCCAESAKKVL